MNNTFLKNTIQELINQNIPFEDTYFVLPGKRPVVFIRKIFQELGYEGFLPQFFTIEELVSEISEIQSIKGIELWIECYKIYKKQTPDETFENFLKWIPTIIKDFNEVDIYAENPEEVLRYMVSVERIENLGIETELMIENKYFWQKMLPFYQALQKHLLENHKGTSAIALKQAVLKNAEFLTKNNSKHFVFLGFNALSYQERLLFKQFSELENTQFFWDIDTYYFEDTIQEAGQFFRQYEAEFPHLQLKKERFFKEFSQPKNIYSVACPKTISQAKYITELLSKPDLDIQETALVLANESNLTSVLESIPKNIQNINITMGYPVVKSAQSKWFESVIMFRKKFATSDKLFTKDALNLIRSVTNSSTEESELFHTFEKQFIAQKNIYLRKEDLEILKKTSIGFVFKTESNTFELMDDCRKYAEIQQENTQNNYFQQAIFTEFASIFKELLVWLKLEPISFESLPKIYQTSVKNQTLDFVGQPLEGLQIMGLLETRLLNFKNIIIADVNEGILPLGRTENSFMPFEVKKIFNIHTFLENDSIYSYHFLRLLQRAEKVHLLYNSVSEGTQNGEKSRFITQLDIDSPHTLQQINVLHQNPQLDYVAEKSIEKTPEIKELLLNWVQNKNISASALGSYLYNPVQFFQQYILGIKEQDSFEEGFSASVLGNIIHNTLEELYKPFVQEENEKPEAFTYENLKAKYTWVESYFAVELEKEKIPQEWFEKGSNLIEKKIAIRKIENLISADLKALKEGNSIQIISLENKFEYAHTHPQFGTINFVGYIDRIDSCNGILRVIDYKSGKVKELKTHSAKGELKALNQDSNQIIQLILYAKMVFEQKKNTAQLQCGIYGLNKLKNGIQFLDIQKDTILTQEKIEATFVLIEDLLYEMVLSDIMFVEHQKKYF